jgi:hypothetical protein
MDICLRAADAGFAIGYAKDAVVHYRLRSELGPLLRQKFVTGVGGAHLWAKHWAAGNIDDYPPRVRRNHALHVVWRLVVGSPQLLSARNRWAYLGQVAKGAGAAVGWWRYSRPVLAQQPR